ncbi:MAG: hypothetical protein AAAC49_18660, partial [Rhizobium leguminosarum]
MAASREEGIVKHFRSSKTIAGAASDLGPMCNARSPSNLSYLLKPCICAALDLIWRKTMRIATLASLTALSLALAASPATIVGIDMTALAKNGGNGGG